MADSDKLRTHSIQNYVSNPHSLTNSFLFFIISAFSVRLVNGSSNWGRVEVRYMGAWGVVCVGSSWNDSAATVVCKQLGFTGGVKYEVTSASHNKQTVVEHYCCQKIANIHPVGRRPSTLNFCFSSNTKASVVCFIVFLVQLFFTQNVQLEGFRPSPWLNANIAN